MSTKSRSVTAALFLSHERQRGVAAGGLQGKTSSLTYLRAASYPDGAALLEIVNRQSYL